MKKRIVAFMVALLMFVGILPTNIMPVAMAAPEETASTQWQDIGKFAIGHLGASAGFPSAGGEIPVNPNNYRDHISTAFTIDSVPEGHRRPQVKVPASSSFSVSIDNGTSAVGGVKYLWRSGDITGAGAGAYTSVWIDNNHVVTNLNCTGIGWNYERFVGMAFSLAHWMEPVKTTWIQVDPGMTDRNGTVVAAGDEVTFYVHGTDTVIGTKKAGEKFYFPESDGRYYFDLYAAEQYAKNNYTGPEMVAQNSCATFASEILINAGMGMYAAYADNARDGQKPQN